MSQPEPWLRGPLDGLPAFLQPLFFSFRQVREDLTAFTDGLTDDQVWRTVAGATLGFHLKHMAGSVDRLVTYLLGGELSPVQMDALAREKTADVVLSPLLQGIFAELDRAEARLRALDPADLFAARSVGRKRLPTTVLGLLTHIAEHTQRHLGEIIVIAKVLKQQG